MENRLDAPQSIEISRFLTLVMVAYGRIRSLTVSYSRLGSLEGALKALTGRLSSVTSRSRPVEFFSLVALFAGLVFFVRLGLLQYAYTRRGVSSNVALLPLFALLLGSYVNVPVVQFPEQNMVFGREVSYFGMENVVPVVADWQGAILAVNAGGAGTFDGIFVTGIVAVLLGNLTGRVRRRAPL